MDEEVNNDGPLGITPDDMTAELEALRMACAGMNKSQSAMQGARFVFDKARYRTTEVVEKRTAEALSMNVRQIMDAMIILRRGMPAEIADVDSGRRKISPIIDELRQPRKPKMPGAQLLIPKKSNKGSLVQMRDGAIWTNLRTALECIGQMPQPGDAARIAIYQARRLKFPLDEKTLIAVEWINKFMGEL